MAVMVRRTGKRTTSSVGSRTAPSGRTASSSGVMSSKRARGSATPTWAIRRISSTWPKRRAISARSPRGRTSPISSRLASLAPRLLLPELLRLRVADGLPLLQPLDPLQNFPPGEEAVHRLTAVLHAFHLDAGRPVPELHAGGGLVHVLSP